MSLHVVERPDVQRIGSASSESSQLGPRTRLADHIEKIHQAQSRVETLAAIRDAAFAAAQDEQHAQRALDAVASAETQDVEHWIGSGARGKAPAPRVRERDAAQRELAQARAVAEARRRAWVAVEGEFDASVAELQHLARERVDQIGDVAVAIGRDIRTEYEAAVRTAMISERRLWTLRVALLDAGCVAAAEQVFQFLRPRPDQKLLTRGEVDQIAAATRSLVDVLNANPYAEFEDAAL